MPEACRALLYLTEIPKYYQQYLKPTTIDVVGLINQKQKMTLPSLNATTDIRRDILERCRANKNYLEHPVLKDTEPATFMFSESPVMASVHGECALAIYLLEQSRSRTPIPSYSYIGASKPSCTACWEFLASFRKYASIQYARKSSGEVCFPWKYPDRELDEAGFPAARKRAIEEMFLERVSLEFSLRAMHFVRMKLKKDPVQRKMRREARKKGIMEFLAVARRGRS